MTKRKIIALLMTIVLLFTMISVPVNAANYNFADINGHWSAVYVRYVCNTKEIMTGTSSTLFSPNADITRADFIMALGKMAGGDINSKYIRDLVMPFTDVGNIPAAPYIKWANAQGIAGGTSPTTFAPNSPLKRQDTAVFIYRYCDAYGLVNRLKTTGNSNFPDLSSASAYARPAIVAMAKGLVFSGSGGNFNPNAYMKRGEAASAFYNYYINYKSWEANPTVRNVNIKVGTTKSYDENHDSKDAISIYIANMSKPFKNRWNIAFNPTAYDNLYGLPEYACTRWNGLCEFNTCGANCSNNGVSANHHKNMYRTFFHLLDNMTLGNNAFRVVASASEYCYRRDDGSHGRSAVGMSADRLALSEAKIHKPIETVRIMQHEISHLYGPDDGVCSKGFLCIMSGGFDQNSTYDLPNIWCEGCSYSFNRTRY